MTCESVSAMMKSCRISMLLKLLVFTQGPAAEVVVGVFEPWWPFGSLHCLLVSLSLIGVCTAVGELSAW